MPYDCFSGSLGPLLLLFVIILSFTVLLLHFLLGLCSVISGLCRDTVIFCGVCKIDFHLCIIGEVDQLTHSEHRNLDVDSVNFLDDPLHVVENLLLALLLIARLVALHDEEPSQDFALQDTIAVQYIVILRPLVERVDHRVNGH